MKKILALSLLAVSAIFSAKAQTAIEKRTLESTSAVLDFAANTSKGIILPAVTTLPGAAGNGTVENGTFVFDAVTKVIKMRQADTWVELSGVGSTDNLVPYSGTVDNGRKTVIGSRTSDADGVLVLEATDKALILPKVANPHLTVKSPYAGMMCYDTTRKALAVFDGKVWNYWK